MEHRPITSEASRNALLARTQRVQARRRMRRPTTTALVLLVVFLGGFASGRRAPAPTSFAESPIVETPQVVAEAEIEGPESLEARATEAPATDRPDLLRRAGDLFVARGDVEAALRCYRDHLTSLPPERVSRPTPEDSWLLAALKHAQD